MSLNNKMLSFFSAALGVAVLSVGAFAQETTPAPEKAKKADEAAKAGKLAGKGFGHRGMGPMGRRGFGPGMALRGINLTDEQKAQIKSIREANKPDAATIAEMKAIHEARKAGQAPTEEQKARMQAFRSQQREKAKGVHEQIMNVLTAEQKAQIETRKTEMRERMKTRNFNRPKRTAPPATDKTSN